MCREKERLFSPPSTPFSSKTPGITENGSKSVAESAANGIDRTLIPSHRSTRDSWETRREDNLGPVLLHRFMMVDNYFTRAFEKETFVRMSEVVFSKQHTHTLLLLLSFMALCEANRVSEKTMSLSRRLFFLQFSRKRMLEDSRAGRGQRALHLPPPHSLTKVKSGDVGNCRCYSAPASPLASTSAAAELGYT